MTGKTATRNVPPRPLHQLLSFRMLSKRTPCTAAVNIDASKPDAFGDLTESYRARPGHPRQHLGPDLGRGEINPLIEPSRTTQRRPHFAAFRTEITQVP
jgi:hypothetical protein